jgi:diguanylate cyclase (GGDEF)-like protein/PAS domain S-box-containing protein
VGKVAKASTKHGSESPSSASGILQTLEKSRLLQTILEQEIAAREHLEGERSAWSEEKRLLRAMIDQVPDYLFVKDRDCRFVVANKAVAADLGLEPEELIGKSDRDLHPRELWVEFLANEQRVMRTGEPSLDHEEYVLLRNGEKRWLSTSKVPLRNDEGAVIGLVGISRDVTTRKHDEARMRHLAYHDQLTGLANRARLELELRGEIELKNRSFLLVIDLDGFKQVNDTYGHAAGDDLLRQVGDRLSRIAAKDGFVSRMGGDEFAMILPRNSALEDACEAIAQDLGQSFSLSGKAATIGAGIGVAAIGDAPSASEALRRADFALYAAKAAGRGEWRVYEKAMGEARERRLLLQADLPEAIELGAVFPVYQPIYDIDGVRPVGAELLGRWLHPRLGMIPPLQFIPIAEETGLIDAIGYRMLRHACDLLAHSSVPWIAVNVSTVELQSPAFATSTLETISLAGIAPSRIQLEITESVLLQDSATARSTLDYLSAAGVRLGLDDFGTGYSSLSYLSRFPVGKIKIDRSFVSTIGSRSANAIVKGIVALAHSLDMKVTAEGVETEEQRAFLKDVGCDELQGYLFARPGSGDALASAFEKSVVQPVTVAKTPWPGL